MAVSLIYVAWRVYKEKKTAWVPLRCEQSGILQHTNIFILCTYIIDLHRHLFVFFLSVGVGGKQRIACEITSLNGLQLPFTSDPPRYLMHGACTWISLKNVVFAYDRHKISRMVNQSHEFFRSLFQPMWLHFPRNWNRINLPTCQPSISFLQ